MTCSHNQPELKCKFPACPCLKCARLRTGNSKNGNLPNRCCHDTPPERPLPKYRFQSKCAAKLEHNEPRFQRKSYFTQKHNRPTRCEEKMKECLEDDDCYTGIGCCNTGRNFLTFMINLIGYMAFVIIVTLVFWLTVCYWVVVLGFKVYHSKRTAQIAVVSVIGLLFLLIFCTADWKVYKKGSTHHAVTITHGKEVKPAEVGSRSWLSFQKRDISYVDGSGKSEAADSSSWMPSLKWRHTETKDIEQPSSKVRTSWIPSTFGSSQTTTTEIGKKTETRTHWISWRTSTPTQISATKSEVRVSWLPSFKWGHKKPKDFEQQPETRTSWMPWRKTSTAVQTPAEPEASSSWTTWTSWRRTSTAVQTPPKPEASSLWLPSYLKWGRKEAISTPKTVEVRTSWTSYFTRQKASPLNEPPSKDQSRSSWTSYFQWHRTAPIEKQSKETEKRSWFHFFKWGQSQEMDVKLQKSDGSSISWLPSFNCGRSRDLQISHGSTTKSSSWLPSFNWGRQSPTQKPASWKIGCKPKSACAMRQQKVTVSIDDEEANRIFKQSKLYAIPSEMKTPPKLQD
ncbi:uncharacterized protein [Eurosta solidaginis]|uniref:uncharacterized protein isoform X2 n=1 Tax=Eurosta solidaginis TaxID=178769 RepID=UPI003530D703